MPYARKRSSFRRRKPTYRKRVAPSTKRITKVVKALSVKADRKDAKVWRPTSYNSFVPATATTVGLLTGIAQGDNDNQRNGNKIKVLGLDFYGHMALPTNPTPASWNDVIRVIIFKDRACNGALATASAILEDTSDVFSPYNEDNLPRNSPRRFTILYDRMHVLNATVATYTGSAVESGTVRRPFRVHKKLNIPVQFNSTAGAITELNNNNLGYLTICSQNASSMAFDIQVSFCDAEGL